MIVEKTCHNCGAVFEVECVKPMVADLLAVLPMPCDDCYVKSLALGALNLREEKRRILAGLTDRELQVLHERFDVDPEDSERLNDGN